MKFSDYIKTDKDKFEFELMSESWLIDILSEVFNTKIDIKRTHFINYIFSTEFMVEDDKYEVLVSGEQGNFIILFIRNDDFGLSKKSSKQYQGKVFSGVFGSIDMFLSSYKVDLIFIRSYKRLSHLVNFYDSGVFKKIFFKRNLEFVERITQNDLIEWKFKFNEKLKIR